MDVQIDCDFCDRFDYFGIKIIRNFIKFDVFKDLKCFR